MKKLRIPIVKGARPRLEPTRDEVLFSFAHECGISTHEARFYLEDASYDVATARAAFAADAAWEGTAGIPTTAVEMGLAGDPDASKPSGPLRRRRAQYDPV